MSHFTQVTLHVIIAMHVTLDALNAASIFKQKRLDLISWQELNKKSVSAKNIGLCVQLCAQNRDACKAFKFHDGSKECHMAFRVQEMPRRIKFWRGLRDKDFATVHVVDSVWKSGEEFLQEYFVHWVKHNWSIEVLLDLAWKFDKKTLNTRTVRDFICWNNGSFCHKVSQRIDAGRTSTKSWQRTPINSKKVSEN